MVQQAFCRRRRSGQTAVRLGGKMGPVSGPARFDLTVAGGQGLAGSLVQRWPQTKGFAEVPCGDCACLACNGIDVIVGSVRQQVLGLEVFAAFGIEPTERSCLRRANR